MFNFHNQQEIPNVSIVELSCAIKIEEQKSRNYLIQNMQDISIILILVPHEVGPH